MPEATREEMLALATLPRSTRIGLEAWKREWVPWLGASHRSYEERGCHETLLTHLSQDETRVYLLHGEDMFVLEAYGLVHIESDGSAWINVIQSEYSWLAKIHPPLETT